MLSRLRKKDINFYKVFYQKPVKAKKANTKGLAAFFLILPATVIGLAYGYLRYSQVQLSSSLAQMQAYIQNPETASEYQQVQDRQSELAEIRQNESNLSKVNKAIQSYPVLTGSDFQKFNACSGTAVSVKGISYDSSKASLSFTAVADSANLLPEYIKRISETNIFFGITYSGYKINSDGKYECVVSCALKTGAQP